MYLELCTKDQMLEFFAEFNATEESVSRDVEYLMQWIEKEPHLPNINDKDLLTNFLLRGKNSIERTKKLIDNYYTARALLPELFTNRDLTAKYVQNVRKFAMFLPMPKLTPNGHRIMVFRISTNCNEVPSAIDILKCMQMVFDFCLKYDKVRGTTLIYDLGNASASYISTMVAEFKKLVMVQNKVNPLRYDKIYLLNVSPLVQPLINILSLFIKKQLEKVVVWKRPNSELSDVLPPKCLPKEFGGTEKTFNELSELYFQDALRIKDWFLEDEKLKADLTKKTGAANCKSETLVSGTQGSFRKLCID